MTGRVTVTKEPIPGLLPGPAVDGYLAALISALPAPNPKEWPAVPAGTAISEESASLLLAMDVGYQLATRHATDVKVQNFFRERYLLFRGGLIAGGGEPPASITASITPSVTATVTATDSILDTRTTRARRGSK